MYNSGCDLYILVYCEKFKELFQSDLMFRLVSKCAEKELQKSC